MQSIDVWRASAYGQAYLWLEARPPLEGSRSRDRDIDRTDNSL